MTNIELWQTILGELEIIVSKANFTTWFQHTFILQKTKDELTIAVPNAFTKEWLENKYNKLILSSLGNIHPEVRKLAYVIKSPVNIPERNEIEESGTDQDDDKTVVYSTELNNRYTFTSFVVGRSNEMAYAAAKSIAGELNSNNLNPLFIYGEVGLGKTHLLQSIGNSITTKNAKIKYATSEKFTGDFVNSLRERNINQFKNEYRDNDLLLIDDIQFIGSKEQTQSEFFHTFNTLYQNNKQVVLTSDRAPRDIKALESRLRSRFEGGMLVDISPPNIETRLAILQEKQNAEGVEVPDNIIEYIARHVKNNIRELEGALNKIMAHARLRQEMPGLKESISILESLVREPIRKTTNNRAILKCVSEFYGIPTKDIISRGRKQEVVKPRQVAMYLMRLECNTSYPSIGDEVGGRDHTTAIHSYKQVENNLRNNELLNDEIESIRERLYS